jgi:hypothetical protein
MLDANILITLFAFIVSCTNEWIIVGVCFTKLASLCRYFFWWIKTWIIRGVKPFIDMITLNSKQIYGKLFCFWTVIEDVRDGGDGWYQIYRV